MKVATEITPFNESIAGALVSTYLQFSSTHLNKIAQLSFVLLDDSIVIGNIISYNLARFPHRQAR
jgi:hypothetical protein